MKKDLSFCKQIPLNNDERELDIVHVYNFLNNHVLFSIKFANFFNKCVDFEYQRVDPKTREISDEPNAVNEVWIEAGAYLGVDPEMGKLFAHDYDLDCGGETFEDALCNLAVLVYEKYGLGTPDTWESVKEKIIKTHDICYR